MNGLGRANLGDAASDNGWGDQGAVFIKAYNANYAQTGDDQIAYSAGVAADQAVHGGPGGTALPPTGPQSASAWPAVATDSGLFLRSFFGIQSTPPPNMTPAQQAQWAALGQTPWYRTTPGIIGILAVVGIGAYLFMGKSHQAPVGGHRIRRKR